MRPPTTTNLTFPYKIILEPRSDNKHNSRIPEYINIAPREAGRHYATNIRNNFSLFWRNFTRNFGWKQQLTRSDLFLYHFLYCLSSIRHFLVYYKIRCNLNVLSFLYIFKFLNFDFFILYQNIILPASYS